MKKRRLTHCFRCGNDLDSLIDPTCPICGWLFCEKCKACACDPEFRKYYFGRKKRKKQEREEQVEEVKQERQKVKVPGMKLKELKEDLANLPDDYDIDLQVRVQVCLNDDGTIDEDVVLGKDESRLSLVVNEPIVGLAITEKDKRIRFVTAKQNELDHLEITKRF
jgi:hypothetical protein